jgi:hypothetical protein
VNFQVRLFTPLVDILILSTSSTRRGGSNRWCSHRRRAREEASSTHGGAGSPALQRQGERVPKRARRRQIWRPRSRSSDRSDRRPCRPRVRVGRGNNWGGVRLPRRHRPCLPSTVGTSTMADNELPRAPQPPAPSGSSHSRPHGAPPWHAEAEKWL